VQCSLVTWTSRFAKVVLAASLTTLLAGACAATTEEDEAGASEDAVIGGAPAPEASWNAVGALVEIHEMGSKTAYRAFCTATLIAPRLVVTAEHCLLGILPRQKYGFAIGAEANRDFTGAQTGPSRVVVLGEAKAERSITGGGVGLGSDVAVISLVDPIRDVDPLAIGSVSASDVGKTFTAIGYGQRQDGSSGTRFRGTVALRALEGKILPHLVSSADAYHELSGRNEAEDRAYYESASLLPDYEVLTSRASRNGVQLCVGDSGGPLLAKRNGKNVVVGVASYVLDTRSAPCDLGTIYGAFGPAARQLVETALVAPGSR
jgi:secreted trypsin-like serine protease